MLRGRYRSKRFPTDCKCIDGGVATWPGNTPSTNSSTGENPKEAAKLLFQAEPKWSRFSELSPEVYLQTAGSPSWVGVNRNAIHFLPGLARALQAAGDDNGADNVLAHQETFLSHYKDQGYLLARYRFAELHALRGNTEQALIELESAEKTRHIYHLWRYKVIDNPVFDGLRDETRYLALVDRVEAELERQRGELNKSHPRTNQIPL